MVVRGYELPSLNLIPDLQPLPDDSDWLPGNPVTNVITSYSKLSKVRATLIKYYREQFLATLIDQAVSKPCKFKPVHHQDVAIDDVVLIKEENWKSVNFPLGVIREINRNYLGEATDVVIFKGATRELIKRHITSVVPLLSKADVLPGPGPKRGVPDKRDSAGLTRIRRLAAEESSART